MKTVPTEKILLTITQVQLAISNSTNNNSIGLNGINIRHLKHLGPLAIKYLTNMYNIASTLTQYPIFGNMPQSSPFQNQHWHQLTTYITSITHCQNTRENTTVLPYITENIPIISHQHGFKHKHSTYTALHNICH